MSNKNRNSLAFNEFQSVYTALMLDTCVDREYSVDRLRFLLSSGAGEKENMDALLASGKITAEEYGSIIAES